MNLMIVINQLSLNNYYLVFAFSMQLFKIEESLVLLAETFLMNLLMKI